MAEYKFQYSLGTPEVRTDGSGQLAHDLKAEAAVVGTEDWFTVRHKTLLLPASELSAILATGTTGQKGVAYKQLVAANINTAAQPVSGWGLDQLQALVAGNEESVAAVAASVDYVENVLNREFPVKFTM